MDGIKGVVLVLVVGVSEVVAGWLCGGVGLMGVIGDVVGVVSVVVDFGCAWSLSWFSSGLVGRDVVVVLVLMSVESFGWMIFSVVFSFVFSELFLVLSVVLCMSLWVSVVVFLVGFLLVLTWSGVAVGATITGGQS